MGLSNIYISLTVSQTTHLEAIKGLLRSKQADESKRLRRLNRWFETFSKLSYMNLLCGASFDFIYFVVSEAFKSINNL